MPDEWTKEQREDIERIADYRVKEFMESGRWVAVADLDTKLPARGFLTERQVARPPDAADAFKIPDLELTRETARAIAKAEISAWSKDQPVWWQPLQRLGGLGLAGVVALGLLEFAGDRFFQAPIISNAVHEMFGTDRRIARAFSAWKNNNTEVNTTQTVREAFNTKLDEWASGADFSTKARNVIAKMASEPPVAANPLDSLVKKALDANPILMFDGQQSLRPSLPDDVFENSVAERNKFCSDSVAITKNNTGSDFNQDLFDALLDDCVAKTDPRSVQPSPSSMDIPFYSRIHTDKDGGRDDVYLERFSSVVSR